MKNVITFTKIDGYKIVTGMTYASIDPVATEKKAKEKIESLKSYSKLTALQKEGAVLQKERIEILQLHRKAEAAKDMSAMDSLEVKYKAVVRQLDSLQTLIIPVTENFDKEYKKLFATEAEYFDLNDNEYECADIESLQVKFTEAAASCDHIDINGKVVPNKKGEYYTQKSGKWIKSVIDKIGVLPDTHSIKKEFITTSQLEEIIVQEESDRISKMSDADKTKEYENALNGLASQAASYQAQQKFLLCEKAAEKAAQDMFDAQKKVLQKKYGV